VWDEIVRLLPDFEDAVLTGLDAEGYPYGVRVRPWADSTGRVIRVPLPAYASIQDGPASLLCHAHDEDLWNLRSFLVRGVLRREEGIWALEPRAFVPGAGVGGPMGLVRFVRGSRQNAERYLKKRGLARPSIPWNRINEIKAQARQDKRLPAVPSGPRRFDPLPWVSALYLLSAAVGAVVAIREGMPGEFLGRKSGRGASADFFRGTGTALSPGLAMLAAQSVLTVLSTRGGKAGMAGTAGLTTLGAGSVVGMLGEPVAYRAFSPKTFDPAKAALVSLLVILPALTAFLGARRLLVQ
jgi:hypothetical protein